MNLRKIAGLLVAGGLMVGLLGAGVGASFTDTATATTNITVGTFSLDVTSTTSGAVVVNNDVTRVHTITYTCPTITSSAPGACPLQISLVNTGSIAITNVAVTWNTVGVPFQAIPMLNSYGPIAAGGHIDIPQAGIMWGQPLTNANLGQTYSVTYTFTASA
jgi:predicted ribosomally synthesized peptide with SipW-like signal peptide